MNGNGGGSGNGRSGGGPGFTGNGNSGGSAPSGGASAGNGSGRKPLAVFTIVEGDNDKSWWRRIGAAFCNRDGSYNVFLDALPVNGRLHVREDSGPANSDRR